MAKKGPMNGETAKPGDAPLADEAASVAATAADGAEGEAGEDTTAVAEGAAADLSPGDLDAGTDAEAGAAAIAVSADDDHGHHGGAADDASGAGDAKVPERLEASDAAPEAGDVIDVVQQPLFIPAAASISLPQMFLALGTDTPDDEIGLTEIAITDLLHVGRLDQATVTASVDMIAEAGLVKRMVSTVFLLGRRADEPDVLLGRCGLQTPVQFGAGNGLHLPARSLIIERIGADAE
jgi:hypothetical protein